MTDSATPISDRALERRIKRWLASGPFDCFIQAAPGLEANLETELRAGGFKPGQVAPGGVAVRLDAAGIMITNLTLRCASRVLLRLGNFPGGSREMLYDRARRIPWELHLGRSGRYRLHMVAKASQLQAGDELALIMKDAIQRRMAESGLNASQDAEAPLEVHVRLLNDHATISLNTSGDHLHRRGFRRYIGEAPVRETVAAGLVMSAWNGHDLVVDPFCGSGTLLLELADLVKGLPPGRARSFGFEHAGWFRPGLWREARRQADADAATAGVESNHLPVMLGFDVDADVLLAAGRNLEAAGHQQVKLEKGDAIRLDYGSMPGSRRLLVGNLPYGKRLGNAASARRLLERFLARMADTSRATGESGAAPGEWDLALLTTQPQLLRKSKLVSVTHEQAVSSGGLRVSLVLGRLVPGPAANGQAS